VAENNWLGIMPVLAYQRFEAMGLEPFTTQLGDEGLFSVQPTDVTNKGYDDSVGGGVRIGWFSKLTDQINFGVSYQTRTWMTKFTKYEGLFAEGGDFDIPATLIAGLSFEPIDNLTLLFDYQRIFYGSVKALNNSNTVFPTGENRLGADDGLGFGWQSINIYKFGVQWAFDPQWTFRAGYSHADQLFEGGDSLFNVMAPATIQDHAAFGGSYRIDDSNEISLAVTRAFSNEIGGSSPLTGPQTGYVEMDQWEVELSWGFQF
jgi:long-chain fatty acid transport protein